jgi:hypothetical protein
MTILEEGFKALADSLVDFGYPDATAAMVRKAHDRWKRGEPPKGIIEMFAVGEFDKRPQIFGTPNEA